jgi:uncharacterized protein DUF748
MSRILKWVGLGFLVLLLIALIGLFFIDEPFRAFAERQLNANVQGYSFRIAKAHLYPNLSLDIENLVMTQTEHPDPPVAQIPKWHFSVQWRHLFSGVLVSDYLIERPTLHITLPQAKKEVKDEVPIHEKGWRDAVYSFYPFKINEFKVQDAEVTYIDQDPKKPLQLHHLNFRAGNIRNIRSKNNTYPSDIYIDAVVFESGKMRLDGNANFMAEPHFGFNADILLDHVVLDYFLPVTARYNVQLRKGLLSAEGHMEYAADDTKVANLKTLTIEGAHVDYVHAPQTQESEKQVAQVTAKAAKELHNKPDTLVKIEKATIKKSEFGFVNQVAKPPYRVFLTNGQMELKNISNQFTEGSGAIKITGKFMGSGDTLVSGTFRPEVKSPDFDLNVKIEKTQLRSLNDLLRAYGNFDVTSGLFSFYSELRVKDGNIDGYLKPLFKELKVYDQRQDADKTLFHKMYEGLVGGISKLLENPQHEIVATKATVSGKVDNPKTNTWQVIGNLIRNAFFKAILPGFEREVSQAKK